MCKIILINYDKEIETPRQFEAHFGFLPTKLAMFRVMNLDSCLCQCNIERTFAEHGIEYEYNDILGYVVTQPTNKEQNT